MWKFCGDIIDFISDFTINFTNNCKLLHPKLQLLYFVSAPRGIAIIIPIHESLVDCETVKTPKSVSFGGRRSAEEERKAFFMCC